MGAKGIGVLVLHEGADQYLDELHSRFPAIDFRVLRRPAELAAAKDFSAAIAYSCVTDGFPRTEHARLRNRPGLDWVHVGGSGFDHLVADGPPGFLLTNGAGVLAPELAQTLLGALIALNRGFVGALHDQVAGRWQPRSFAALGGQCLVIVGTGAIGTAFATLAKSLGLRVVGVARAAGSKPPFDRVAPLAELEAVAAEADYLSLNVRLTDATRHLIDAAVLDAMRPSAFLLNAARGAVVDEAALLRALVGRRIAGAYLDVFETEPLPAASPLRQLDNVLITPHCSDRVADWELRHARFFMANLERRLAGQELLNRVAGD
ncbi:MAG: D-2-hydroxyacid dehydrogenase [Geminicoccaceae bacterium]